MSDSRPRRRILHVAQPTGGGVAEVVMQLCSFGEDDYEHLVAAPDGELALRASAAGARTVSIAMSRQPSLGDAAAFVRLLRAAKDVDLIVLHSSKAGVLGRCVGWLRRKPTVFMPHGWSWSVGGRLAPLYMLLERLLAGATAATVVVGSDELEEGRRKLGRRARFVLIENAVRTREIKPVSGRTADSILVFGRVTEQKGQDLAIRALAEMTRPAGLVIVGDGETRALAELASSLGVRDRVDFRPAAPAKEVLREFVLVAIPSRWEGLPLVMLEAMAAGCAVVASSKAGSAALRGAGVVVPMSSEDEFVGSLAEQFDALIGDDAGVETLGNRARATAEAHYDIARLQDEHLSLWAGILESPKRRSRR